MSTHTHNEEVWQEATRIADYLIGEGITDKEVTLYEKAATQLGDDMNGKECRVWKQMLQYSFIMGVYDAGLAILQPQSPLRRRIFIMLAILEANPKYTSYFLSTSYPKWHLLKLPFVGGWGVLKVLWGILLVKANL